MEDEFRYGDKVRLVGEDNPFIGEEGMFWGYKNRGMEIYLYCLEDVYWFSKDEVRRIE